jgi:cobalamin biosynthesis Mg chelatase CobN
MTGSAQHRTVKAARASAHIGMLKAASSRYRALHQEAGTAMSIETIIIIVVIVLIVLFVLGYFGRGRRA